MDLNSRRIVVGILLSGFSAAYISLAYYKLKQSSRDEVEYGALLLMIVFGITFLYMALSILLEKRIHNNMKRLAVTGAIIGLLTSLFGRHILNLPRTLFGNDSNPFIGTGAFDDYLATATAYAIWFLVAGPVLEKTILYSS